VFVRARSRSSIVNGQTWYHWDNPPGDLERNQRFAISLVGHIASMLPVDRARIYAAGYSSGGNMALSLLTLADSPFSGISAVGENGHVWIAGEAGTMLHSTNGGSVFVTQEVPTTHDLYAIAFRDEQLGVAVGAHGAAVLTRDGGAYWEDISTGTGSMLAGVAFEDAMTVVVVGEAGTFLRLAL
jgi:photosystem II stability/assembly factor-like uncharacterized protein